MSLIVDDGPNTVLVYPEIQQTDARGNVVKRPADTGITVRGVTMQPITSPGMDENGRVHPQYRIMGRNLPLGPWARVEWKGRHYSVLSGPTEVNVTADVRHVSAMLREER